MDPDKYQQAWQANAAQTNITINSDLLFKEVQRSRQNFLSVIFRRDLVEVGIALLLLPYWFYQGIRSSLPWTWYLTVPALVWVAGFILIDRKRHPQATCQPGESLRQCVWESLAQVEHQIWLLRNVFWWYLLPFSISVMAFFVHVAWLSSNRWWEFLAGVLFLGLFLLVVYGAIYLMNQRAVREQLEPRRRELLTLLASLSDEVVGRDAESADHSPSTDSPTTEAKPTTARRAVVKTVIGLLGLVGTVTLVVVSMDREVRDSQYTGLARSSGSSGDALARMITDQWKERKLVGLAAMVMVDGQIESAAAQGERMAGSGAPLEITDRWHLGGITKSITATMIARLVESGQMRWSDTVGTYFPEASVHDDWKPVTLKQLLTDTAGAPRSFPSDVSHQRTAVGPECTQARRVAVLNVLAEKPAEPPGEQNTYSNVSVTIAAAMAEKATGATWEDLVKREVFEPLKLEGAGFGPPRSSARLEQPRGHRTRLAEKIAVDDKADNSPIMGPSGSVHMTLNDVCVYATEHLRGELGDGKLLMAETYQLLHTPELNQYASGWIRMETRGMAPSAMYWHNGSNTMWYALIVFIPEKTMVIAVTSNDGDTESAEAAAWKIVMSTVQPVPKREPQTIATAEK